jgi:hypothetical protein
LKKERGVYAGEIGVREYFTFFTSKTSPPSPLLEKKRGVTMPGELR